MKALEDGPPAVAAGVGVRQAGACGTRHGLRGRRCAVGFRIIASKRSSKDDIYRAMFLEDDD